MKLELENIGLFEKASVDIDGITVIAGENATGKSTIGKALYSIFHGFESYDKKIEERLRDNIYRLLSFYTMNDYNKSYQELFKEADTILKEILEDREKYSKNKKELVGLLKNHFPKTKKSGDNSAIIEEISDRIYESLNLSEKTILESIINEVFNSEFHSEIVSRYNKEAGHVSLIIKEDKIEVSFLNDKVQSIFNPKILTKNIVYIDDPYVLDDLNSNIHGYLYRSSVRENHRNDLTNKIEQINDDDIEKIKVNKKLETIFKKLDGIKVGELFKRGNIYRYKDNASEFSLDIRNVATGLKDFVIIKTLLENGALQEKGIIILDEPEIHLHPKWQVSLAELIVLIQKEFNMHILLNTHSPYFLRAIEVFTEKHGVKDRTKYYLATRTDNVSKIEDVTNNTEEIYSLLVEPLDYLEEELSNDN